MYFLQILIKEKKSGEALLHGKFHLNRYLRSSSHMCTERPIKFLPKYPSMSRAKNGYLD